MVFVFLIYGFSFFVLALAILIYPKTGSRFVLARHLWLVAGFGLAQGANEWVDMFILIRKGQDNFALEVAHLVLLPVSFMFLVCFGVLMLKDMGWKGVWLKLLPWLLGLAWIMIFVLSEDRFLMGDIFSRYLICVPGTVLTALVLWQKIPKMEKTCYEGVSLNLKLAGITFLGYGFFGGLMVHEAGFFPASTFNYENFLELAGFPVQVVRAGCALLNAYCMARILGIFHWESRQALSESELRFHTIVETAPIILFMEDHAEEKSYIEGKGLGVLGLNPKEVLGQPISALFPEVPQIETARRRAYEGFESVFRFCVRGITFEARLSPLTNECGVLTGLIGIAADISEQEKVRTEREKYLTEIGKNQRLVELGMISTKMVKEIDEPLSMTHLL
ncbi:MAG: PAS domain-containing protein, partial [Planctomycetes bacterium]|nr:PAS domain-containing protein [Planctomycetota bacterium]